MVSMNILSLWFSLHKLAYHFAYLSPIRNIWDSWHVWQRVNIVLCSYTQEWDTHILHERIWTRWGEEQTLKPQGLPNDWPTFRRDTAVFTKAGDTGQAPTWRSCFWASRVCSSRATGAIFFRSFSRSDISPATVLSCPWHRINRCYWQFHHILALVSIKSKHDLEI